MHSTETPNRHYRVMVEGADESGGFFTTYEVVIAQQERLLDALGREAETGTWELLRIEEVQVVSESTPGRRRIEQVTGRAYFGENGP